MRMNKHIVAVLLISIVLAGPTAILNEAEGEPSRSNAPVLSMGSVSPTTGNSTTTFNFTVWYSDLDGDAPYNVSVNIDGRGHLMGLVPGYPVDYQRGVPYYFRTTLSAGTHYYYFHVSNINGTARFPSSGNNSLIVNSNDPLLLNLQQSPSRPTADTGVYFNITYKDPTGLAPQGFSFFITDFVNNHTFTMNQTGGNYTTGMQYQIYLKLPAGNYSFRIKAVSAGNRTVFYPSQGHQMLYISPGSTPVDHEPSLYGASVNPTSPMHGDSVLFSVVYRDVDDDAPAALYMEMMDQNGTRMPSMNLTLQGTSYTTGVRAQTSMVMTSGSYHYWFSTLFYNSSSRKYEKVTTANYTLRVGQTPTYPALYNQVVSPSNPVAGRTVNFTVQYRDPLNGQQDPSVRMYIRHIDGPVSAATTLNLTRASSSYHSGVVYYVTTTLASGNYSYYFGYLVYNGSFRHPVYSNLTLYVSPQPVDNAPQLSGGGARGAGSNRTFYVTYKDLDGDAPRNVILNIGPVSFNGTPVAQYFNTYSMTWSQRTYSTGVIATYTLGLRNGSYQYYFTTFSQGSNGNGTDTYPSESYLYLNVTGTPPPPSNSAPVLYSPSLSPSRPTAGTLLNFTIRYRDADGDAPSFVKLMIASGNRGAAAHRMTVLSGNYTAGVTSFKTLNLSAGNYSYYFQTSSSGNLTGRYPSRGSLSLTIGTSGGGGGGSTNRTPNGTAMFYLDPGTGEVTMNIREIDEGLFLEFQGYEDDVVTVRLRSEDVKDRYVSFVIDEELIGMEGDFVLVLDGNVIGSISLEELLTYTGDESLYNVEYRDGEYIVSLFIPDAEDHQITASLEKEEEPGDDFPWFAILSIASILIIAVLVGTVLLSRAQMKKKQEEFYRDFELDLDGNSEEQGVLRGSLDEKDEWEDLLE